MHLDCVTVLFGRVWTFWEHGYYKFALFLDYYRIIRFDNAFIVAGRLQKPFHVDSDSTRDPETDRVLEGRYSISVGFQSGGRISHADKSPVGTTQNTQTM